MIPDNIRFIREIKENTRSERDIEWRGSQRSSVHVEGGTVYAYEYRHTLPLPKGTGGPTTNKQRERDALSEKARRGISTRGSCGGRSKEGVGPTGPTAGSRCVRFIHEATSYTSNVRYDEFSTTRSTYDALNTRHKVPSGIKTTRCGMSLLVSDSNGILCECLFSRADKVHASNFMYIDSLLIYE